MQGYFPVSRMISTFPSASDVAWTEILGDRPLPGYQRTYYSQAANLEVFQNGVTTSMEYERQMTWQVTGGLMRTLGYVFPRRTFKYEVHELVKNFLKADNQGDNYYAFCVRRTMPSTCPAISWPCSAQSMKGFTNCAPPIARAKGGSLKS